MLWPFLALGLIGSFIQLRLTALRGGQLGSQPNAGLSLLFGLTFGLALGLLASSSWARRMSPELGALFGLVMMGFGVAAGRADAVFVVAGTMAIVRAGMRADVVRRGSVLHRALLRGAWSGLATLAVVAFTALLILAPALADGRSCTGHEEAAQLNYLSGLIALICGVVLVAEDIGAARSVGRLCLLELRPRPPDGYAGVTFDFVDLGTGDEELEGRNEGGYRGSGTPDTIVRGDPVETTRMIRRAAIFRAALLLVAAVTLHAVLLFGL